MLISKKVLKGVSKLYLEEKRQTLIKLKGRYMSLVIAQVWRARSKRWCAQPNDYSELYKNRARRSFSIGVPPMINQYE